MSSDPFWCRSRSSNIGQNAQGHAFAGLGDRFQSKVDGCSLSDRTFRPDLSLVPVDDALYGCQAYSGPREFSLPVKTLKGAKKRVGVLHIDPSPVVAYKT